MLAEGFGPGANGPLLVVADLSPRTATRSARSAAGRHRRHHGVAAVSPPTARTRPATPRSSPSSPTTGPQDAGTEDLVRTLRDDVIPAATEGTGAEVHVGGATAARSTSTRPSPTGSRC